MAPTLETTPAADGFRMPGEFEPHAGCWMAWPERPDNWREGAAPAQEAFASVAEAIAVSEPVTMAVSGAQYERCRALLSPAVRVLEIETDDAWMRDIGPSFVTGGSGELRGVDWVFNAGGALKAGSTRPGSATIRPPQKDPRAGGRRPLQGPAGPGGRFDPCRRPGDGPDD